MFKQFPEKCVTREQRKQHIFAAAAAYKEKHSCRWSEACAEVAKMYGPAGALALRGVDVPPLEPAR